jgi:hypothetical protein
MSGPKVWMLLQQSGHVRVPDVATTEHPRADEECALQSSFELFTKWTGPEAFWLPCWTAPFRILDLPAEILRLILAYLLPTGVEIYSHKEEKTWKAEVRFMRACKAFHQVGRGKYSHLNGLLFLNCTDL